VIKGFKKTEGISEFEECMTWLVGLPENTKGNWKRVNLLEGGRHSDG